MKEKTEKQPKPKKEKQERTPREATALMLGLVALGLAVVGVASLLWLSTLMAAILGGIAGNQIDKAVNNTTGERITVRLDQKRNGTRNYTVVQVASRNNPIQVGQRVRVIIGNNGSRVLAY